MPEHLNTEPGERTTANGSERRGGRGGPRSRGRGRSGFHGPSQNNRRQDNRRGVGLDKARVPSEDATPTAGTPEQDVNDSASDMSSDVCFICADPVKYSAVLPCDHRTCHICCLRMRALYKKKECAHCRTESDVAVFTKDHLKHWDEFAGSDFVGENATLGLKFDDQVVMDDTMLLLRYNCPDPSCDQAFRGWPALQFHTKQDHDRLMCDLCVKFKKVFAHEHSLFTPAQLKRHQSHGDDKPGAQDQSGFTGHPLCEFCNKRFYSNDEIFDHCRHDHERCFICDRRATGSTQPVFYLDYNSLAQHFANAHHPCNEPECIEKRFVVFDSEIDLKGHYLEEHPGKLSKSARKDFSRIDMSEFTPFEHPRGAGRRRGRGGRGGPSRRPDEDSASVRTEQNLSRAEIAFHRQQQLENEQRIVQTSQTVTSPWMFNGQLTDDDSEPWRTNELPPPRPQSLNIPAAASTRDDFPPLASSSAMTTSASSRPARPSDSPLADEVRRKKHGDVQRRAANMLSNNQAKMSRFQALCSDFTHGRVDGIEMIQQFSLLFGQASGALGSLVKELAEIYEDENKRTELLKAWNNWKSSSQPDGEFPPIAGASSSGGPTVSTSRVLQIKSSTARSGRSTAAQTTAWGTAASNLTGRPVTTTPVPQANSSRAGVGKVSAATWARPSIAVQGSASAPNTRREQDFPSLPQPPKKPAGWGPVPGRRNQWDRPPVTNAWSETSSSQELPQEELPEEDSESAGNGKGKKKKEKITLMRIGVPR